MTAHGVMHDKIVTWARPLLFTWALQNQQLIFGK